MEHQMLSLADQVFDVIERDILNGTLERGEYLTETALSDRLGERFMIHHKSVRRNITKHRNGAAGNDRPHNIARSERRHIYTVLGVQLNRVKECGHALHLAGKRPALGCVQPFSYFFTK